MAKTRAEQAVADETEKTGISEKSLTPAAKRALAEAKARRQQLLEAEKQTPREIAGRGGLDPARYGDWEVKGLTSDF